MGVAYEVTAITGEYQDKNGQKKNRYMKCGVVIESKHGLMLKMEAYPVGGDGLFFLNAPREKDQQNQGGGNSQQQHSAPAGGAAGMDDDIPF